MVPICRSSYFLKRFFIRGCNFRGLSALALTLAISLPGLAAPTDRLIAVQDLLQVKELGAPTLSPDGSQIVYTVRSIEERAEKAGDYLYRTQLWLVATNGRSAPRQLTRAQANDSSPVWHPKGDRLAFVRQERDRQPQIWVLPLAAGGGGEAYPLTHYSLGANSPKWSPDGTLLLFSATLNLWDARRELEIVRPTTKLPWFGERPGRQFADTENWGDKRRRNPKNGDAESLKVAPKPEGTLQEQREWLAKNESEGNPVVTTRLDFLGEQDLEATETFSHLYAIEVEKGTSPVPLTPGLASYQEAVWYTSPTGLQVLFSGEAQVSEHPDRILERDLWVVNATGGPSKRLLHDDEYAYTDPLISPDGSMIAFLAVNVRNPGYANSLLCVLPTRGGPRRFLTTRLDRSIQSFRWAPDSQSLYFTAASNGGQPLYRVPTAGGKIDRLTSLTQGIVEFDVHSSGIVTITTKPSNPSELVLLNAKGDDPTVLTSHNSEWLRDKILAAPERREVSTPDGLQIDAWVMKPPTAEANRRYPLLVEIHGGPQAMWGPGDASMWHEFQYFTARGYGIVYCNPRGSSGYGYAFQHENYQNWGPGPARDVLAAASNAVGNNWVDSARQVITGGSYGGYLTVFIIAQDHRFKAAAAQRGVYDLSIFFGEGNAWRLVPYHFGGYPWQPDIRALLNAQSPLSHVAKITTPLLINQGETDLRAGVIQSEMLYKSMKVMGCPVEYARYPGATHELSRSGDPKQRIDRLVRMDEFFQRFIGPVQP